MPYKDKGKQKEAQRKYDEKRKGTRHRGWLAILYLDSAVSGWHDVLTAEGVPAFISPLHDRDVNADGTPKKPHFHVLLLWDGVNTFEAAKAIFDAIGAVTPPKNPKPGEVKPWAVTVRGSARYLCHLDNPEKAQYDPQRVKTLNATLADYLELISSAGDDDAVLDEITDYIDENGVVSFAAFVRYCKEERPEWKRLAYHRYAAFITRYIKSCAWERNNDLEIREKALAEYESDVIERAREKAEFEAGNVAMAAIENVTSHFLQNGSN